MLNDDPDAVSIAEDCFKRAVEISKLQNAKLPELRACLNLARLWQIRGRIDQAWEVLDSVYGWFTEGFDTADLKDAKALLNELA